MDSGETPDVVLKKQIAAKRRLKKLLKEGDELKQCIDICCGNSPIVQFDQGFPNTFRILCKWCFNEVKNTNSTRAMIEWNKMIRKVK